MIKVVRDLTGSETFYLSRRRHGVNRIQMAKQFKVTKDVITFWESGRLSAPNVSIRDPLTAGEILHMTRRRVKLTLSEAAFLISISRLALIHHEKDRVKDQDITNNYCHVLGSELTQ
jgi:DNA-binding XRE family transcriptional regulator